MHRDPADTWELANPARSSMRDLADACMRSPTLQYLVLEGSSRPHAANPFSSSTRTLLSGGDFRALSSMSSSKIEVLELDNLCIRYSDLETFLATLAGRISITLSRVMLLGGEPGTQPCVNLLDLLRTRSDASSKLEYLSQESGPWPLHFANEAEYEQNRLLTDYITGRSDQNPLLPPPPPPPQPAAAAADDAEEHDSRESEEQSDSEEEEGDIDDDLDTDQDDCWDDDSDQAESGE